VKAAQMTDVGQPLQIVDIPEPALDPEDERDDIQTIVQVKACGLCGTDLHHLKGTAKVSRLPITLGHEISGVVTEVGRTVAAGQMSVPSFKPGDRVAVNNVIWCGECRPCLRGKYNFCQNALMFGRDVDGGLAEYVKVPARNLSLLPEGVPFAEAAILGCGVVTAYHALRIGRVGPGDAIVVWGGGGVGLALVHLARELSAAYPIIVVEKRKRNLILAMELGADFAIDAAEQDPVTEIMRITKDNGADAVFDTAGVKTIAPHGELTTLAAVCPGGQLIVVATYGESVTVEPHDDIGIFEKRFTGSCGNLPDELDYLVNVVAGGRRLTIDKLITQRLGLEEVNRALEDWRAGTELVVRPVVLFE